MMQELEQYQEKLAVLDAQIQDLDDRMADLRMKKQELSKTRDRMLAEQRAQQVVANMSDNEKAALMQALSVPGVPSTATAGEPSGA